MNLEPLVQPLRADAGQYIQAFKDAAAELNTLVNSIKKFGGTTVGEFDKAGQSMDKAFGRLNVLERRIRRLQELQSQARARFGTFPEVMTQQGRSESDPRTARRIAAGMGIPGRAQQESIDAQRRFRDLRGEEERRNQQIRESFLGTSAGRRGRFNLAGGMGVEGRRQLADIEAGRRMVAGMTAAGRPEALPFNRFDAMARQRARQRLEDGAARAEKAARDRRGREIIGRVKYHQEKDRLRADSSFKGWASKRGPMYRDIANRAQRRRLRLQTPGVVNAIDQMKRRDRARMLYARRHPFRAAGRAAGAAGGLGMDFGKSAVSGTADFLGSVFNVNSVPGLIMTLTGVNLALAGIRLTADTVAGAFHHIATSGMEMERTRVTFEVMLGSAEKGQKLFADVQRLAVLTPYTYKTLQSTSQTLLGMGVEPGNIIPSMSRIGDVAGGNNERFRSLSYAFGQTMAEGKVSGMRMRQFATAGVGTTDFAQTMGVSPTLFRAMMRENMVSSNVMAETFNRLTSVGGRFFNLSNRGLETVYGQWERISDIIDQVAGKMGIAFFEHSGLAQGMSSFADFIQEMEPRLVAFAARVGDVMGGIGKASGPFFGGIGEGAGYLSEGWGPSLAAMMPTMGEVHKGAEGVLDVFVNIADVLGTMVAKMGEFAGIILLEAPKFYANLSNSWMGKAMGMTPVSQAQYQATVASVTPTAAFLQAMPLMHKGAMRATRAGIEDRRFAQQQRDNFVGPMPLEKGQQQEWAERNKLIGLRDEFFPEGVSIVQQVLGKLGHPGAVSKSGQIIGKSLGSGTTALEGFVNRREAIMQQYMGGPNETAASRLPFTAFGGAISNLGVSGKDVFGPAGRATYRGVVNAGLGMRQGLDMGLGVDQVMKLAGAGLQMAGAFMPMGALAGGGRFQVATYDNYMKLRQDMGHLTDPASRLSPAATYGSSEAVDAINKAMLNTSSVEEEVLRTLEVANELHRSTNAYQAEVNRVLNEINAGKLVVREENP